MRNVAMSLIEVLVVVAIIAILAALIVAGANALGVGSKKNRTLTILETVRQALEVTAAQSGSFPTPVEHPLAGSFAAPGAPRLRFVRADAGHAELDREVTGALGTAREQVALSGVGADEIVPAFSGRLMLPGDLYADRQVPLLYGLARERIGVLGAKLAQVTRYRRLPRPPAGQRIADADDLALYPNATRLVWSDVEPEGNKRTLDYVLGATNAGSELAKLGALFTPPDDDPDKRHAWGRVWCAETRAAGGAGAWKAGMLDDPQRPQPATHAWKRYRLRGLAIYDAWGIEVIATTSASGALRLGSAGRDGAFRVDPGPDGAIATDAWAEAPAGDDRDGAIDNVMANVGGG